MLPVVTDITERKAVDQKRNITTAIVVTYKVGDFGPFTLITNQQEMQNGQAQAKMQAFARTLQQLPLAPTTPQ